MREIPDSGDSRFVRFGISLETNLSHMATFTSFEQLPCWQKCREVQRWTIDIVQKFPKNEMYELVFSIRKCARSATRNLAEGFGKFSAADKVNFCRISKGSLYELTDDLITAVDEGYLTTSECEDGRALISEAVQSINGYMRYLKSRKENGWDPK